MKRTSILLLAILAVLCATAVSQNTKQLFQPVAITDSGPILADYTDATPFATTTVYMDCEEGDTAVVSGTQNGTADSLIVDNYIQVQSDTLKGATATTDICPNLATAGCFSGTNSPTAKFGQPAENGYYPVPDQAVPLVEGKALYTFRLMDWGVALAASPVWLRTSCHIFDLVCHYDNGKKMFKTLTLDPNGIAAHLKQHSNDYLGACTQ